MVSELPPRIVLYDGVCGLCHWTVAWLLTHDRNRELHFAPLQGETAERLRAQHPTIPTDLDTVVFVDDGRVHLRSRAFLHIAKYLPYPWRVGALFRAVPAPVADLFYRFIAGIRYRVWGQYDACRVPDTEERAQLLP
ncbi:MAG: DCC1-like thiol-disulfide oxidoreductase family protein [Polyangiales bacterium]